VWLLLFKSDSRLSIWQQSLHLKAKIGDWERDSLDIIKLKQNHKNSQFAGLGVWTLRHTAKKNCKIEKLLFVFQPLVVRAHNYSITIISGKIDVPHMIHFASLLLITSRV
jgi:hypothetical protein